MHDHRPSSSHSTDELLQLVAVRRSRLVERATILKRELRVLAAQLTACEQSIDELDRTEKHLLERATILKRELRVLAARLTACEEAVDELDRTEKDLLAENVARLERKAEETLPE
jgi:hypothetical protein